MTGDPPARVGVVGLGLIGGSILRSLGNLEGFDVMGFDSAQGVHAQVRDAGFGVSESLAALVRWSDVLVLCVPIGAEAAVLDEVAAHAVSRGQVDKPLVVTDASSVKLDLDSAILQQAKQEGSLVFVPGHPMAGTEKAGFQASLDGLFGGAVWVLCPDQGETEEYVVALMGIISALNARAICLTVSDHNRIVAEISHLPYVLAATEVLAVSDGREGEQSLRLAASSFRDVTRVASSPPSLSAAMTGWNHQALRQALDRAQEAIDQFRSAMDAGGVVAVAQLEELFEAARAKRTRYLGMRSETVVKEADVAKGTLVSACLELGSLGHTIRSVEDGGATWRLSSD